MYLHLNNEQCLTVSILAEKTYLKELFIAVNVEQVKTLVQMLVSDHVPKTDACPCGSFFF